MNKRRIKILLKLVVTCGLLAWLFYKLDTGQIIAIISGLSLSIYILVNIIHFISDLFGSLKWKFLLSKFSYLKLLKLYIIGSYYSLVLPGQIAGEAAKAYILGKYDSESEKIAVSVMIDKITGIIGLLLLSIAGLLFSKLNLSPKIVYSFIIGVIICVAMLFSIRVTFLYNLILKIFNALKNRFTKAEKQISFLINILASWQTYTKKTGLMLISVLMGIGYQLFAVLIYSTIAMNLGIDIPFYDWLWIIGLLSIVLLLPISIAGIGVREGTLVGVLAFLGFPAEKAMALSLSILGIQIIWAIVGAIVEIKR